MGKVKDEEILFTPSYEKYSRVIKCPIYYCNIVWQTGKTLSLKIRRSAFTLIELLVVIAIISILASMIFPSFGRAREMARRTSCSSNLHQLGLAVLQYTQDYDEHLPSAWVGLPGEDKTGGWVYYSTFGTDSTAAVFDVSKGGLYPYIKSSQIFLCPSDDRGQRNGESYAINGCAMQPEDANRFAAGKMEAAFEQSSLWMLFSEEGTISSTTDDGYQRLGENTFSYRHLDGSNIAFMDGHVKFQPLSRIEVSQFQTGGQGTTCP
jgi:prepilin-type N-terminal cleavage/methylation domain-containing protein/prepilin-type processing-associated H-X9-DG protein